jgi:hypothetical protein
LPINWNVETGANLRWQPPLPGLVHASPIVCGDRVCIATAVKAGKAQLKVGFCGDITPVEEKETHQRRLLALDKATGKIIWNTLGREGCREPSAIPRQARAIQRRPRTGAASSRSSARRD